MFLMMLIFNVVGVFAGLIMPMSMAQDFTLAGTGETLPLNGVIDINMIGDGFPDVSDSKFPVGGNGSLVCHTDDTTCCRGLDNPDGGGRGEWYLAGQTTPIPPPTDTTADWYRSRGTSVLRLNRRNAATTPTGVYRCIIPTTSGTVDKFIGVYDTVDVGRCPNLDVANGVVTYDRADIPGKIATYTCNTGYTISGSSTRTCASGGWQGSEPICVQGTGDITTSIPTTMTTTPSTATTMIPAVSPTRLAIGGRNNVQDSTIPITDVGQGGTSSPALACFITSYTIAEWYYPNGNTVAVGTPGPNVIVSARQPSMAITLHRGATVFSPGGLYCCGSQALPVDQRLCITLLAVCPSLTLPTNGMAITYNPPGPPTSQGTVATSQGTVATYQCIAGYAPNPSTRTCQSDGTWSGGETTCQSSVNCGPPTNIANGSPGIPDMTTLGGTVTYTCDSGYQLSGSATVTCMNSGSWSTRPTCTAICDDLSPPDNGAISYNPDTTPKLQSNMATYTCNSGYTGGPVTRTCQFNRMWSGTAITCTSVDCGLPPSIANGSPGTPDMTTFGGTVTYTCEDRLTISGQAMITCMANGMWRNPPQCTAPPTFTCPDLTVRANEMITYNFGVTNVRPVDSTATYSCVNGYIINGDTTRTCQSDGTWSGVEPTCGLPPAVLSLGSTNYLVNGQIVPLSSVGEGVNSLSCRTDDSACCREEDSGVVGGLGAWHYPNGSVVSSGDLYTTREGPMVVNLNRRDGVDGPTGIYCCVVPTSTGTRPVCAYLGSPLSQPDNTGAIVGGVVAICLVLSLSITAIVIAYLVLRQRKPQGVNSKRDQPDIPLTDKGQSTPPQAYETVDTTCTYEEIDGTRPLKGISDYTQNQAYAATTAPPRREGVVNTGGSGNLTGDSQVGGDEGKIYEN